MTSRIQTDGTMLVGGHWVSSAEKLAVSDKDTGEELAVINVASREDVGAAVDAAVAAMSIPPPEAHERARVLRQASDLVEGHADQLVDTIVSEGGFTVSEATTEVARCVETLLITSEEAKRITGEMVPVDGARGQRDRLAFTLRFPIGVVCAITPFNSPLNTVAHKIAPAFAAGNACVLKPASLTPLSSELLVRILMEAGVPDGFMNVVHGPGSTVGRWLVEEQRIAFYAFTGSTEVGRSIQEGAGLRRTQMELGSISGTIVCDDADLDVVVNRCVGAAFRKAGQVCTSVQRLYVERSVVLEVEERLAAALTGKNVGSPRDPDVFIGPMISQDAAARAGEWIDEAVQNGSRLVAGGGHRGARFEPTVLADVPPTSRVVCDEIFAPVVSLVPFDSLKEAIAQLNSSPYGLAAGIFTQDIDRAMFAARQLRMGTVHINESSSSRVDLAPYGGTKESGHGREGPKYAIREMTEERLVTLAMREPAE